MPQSSLSLELWGFFFLIKDNQQLRTGGQAVGSTLGCGLFFIVKKARPYGRLSLSCSCVTSTPDLPDANQSLPYPRLPVGAQR